ncbi:hypothetical protein EON65_13560 [archaeon]|nr:MAG: hypothetical protein EON65_13560 [archaeon]
MTQTPDDWMTDISEPALEPEEVAKMKLSNQMRKGNDDNCDNEGAGQDGAPDYIDTSRTMNSSITDTSTTRSFQLSPEVAHHLIAFVYQTRVSSIIDYRCKPLSFIHRHVSNLVCACVWCLLDHGCTEGCKYAGVQEG